LNEGIRPFLHTEEERLRRERDQCRACLRINEVRGRRDYAFCLHPAESLRELFRKFHA
jgi:hypothetical protein